MIVYVRVESTTREVIGVYSDQNVELKSERLIPFEVQNLPPELAQREAQPETREHMRGYAIETAYRAALLSKERHSYLPKNIGAEFTPHEWVLDAIQTAHREALAASPQEAQPESKDGYGGVADLRDAKWLDPECASRGACQSLRFKAPQPMQTEPVAWRYKDVRGNWRYTGTKPDEYAVPLLKPEALYTAQPTRERLSDEQRDDAIRAMLEKRGHPTNPMNAARAGWYAAVERLVRGEGEV